MSLNSTGRNIDAPMRFKVSIVGCGSVGATIAYALLLDGTATDLSLIDIEKEKAEGIALDLEHSLPFLSYTRLAASDDFGECKNSDVTVVTAGRRQKHGESRLDMISANRNLFNQIIPKIVSLNPQGILIIISNPVDILTHHSLKVSKLPWQRVFGTGTVLDTARFQFHLSEILKINPRSIDAYIMGEHGDSAFPVLSSANIIGKRLLEMDGFSQAQALECFEKTKSAAYRIIHDVGFTCYSIATALREILKSIYEDNKNIFMLSAALNDYYGHSNICLSVPCVLGRSGIERILKVPLDEKEQENLNKSVKTMREFIS